MIMRRIITIVVLLACLMGVRATTPAKKDVFIKVTPSKERVYEQEPVTLSITVCSVNDVSDVEGKMPELSGFYAKEVEMPKMKTFHKEVIGGRTYNTVLWSKYIMYPQMTGNVTVPPVKFRATVMKESAGDATEDFFNDRQRFTPTKVTILSPSVTIRVMPLPQRPAGFSGGVGAFSISASMAKTTVKTGDPVEIKVVVRGNGNLKTIKAPKVVFPRDFEVYDTKTADSFTFTDKGYSGYVVFTYTAIPKNQGKYTIPAIAFTYFDLQSESYKTITTQPFSLQVNPGKDNYVVSYRDDANSANGSFWSKASDFILDNMAYLVLIIGILLCVSVILIIIHHCGNKQ